MMQPAFPTRAPADSVQVNLMTARVSFELGVHCVGPCQSGPFYVHYGPYALQLPLGCRIVALVGQHVGEYVISAYIYFAGSGL